MYVSYDFYKQTFGGAIPEADFSKVEAKAEAVIGYLTYVNGDVFAREDSRVKLAVCAAAENVDQVAENFIFKADAVEKNLKNVARLGFHRLRRFGGFIRLRRALGGELRDGGVQVIGVECVIVSLRNGLAGLRGAAADKLRDADGLDLGLQLDGLFQIVRLMQREALRQRPLPLADLGNELQIVWN